MTSLMVQPTTRIFGEFTPPGDKSITHRAIIYALLAKGTSTFIGALQAKDCQRTLKACLALGASAKWLSPTVLRMEGVGKEGLRAPQSPIDLGNSGTSARLLLGLLAAQSFKSTLLGDESLSARPMERVISPLEKMGARISSSSGHLPINVFPSPQIKGIDYQLPIASAQLKSSLLLAALFAKGPTRLVEPLLTRDHSERLLEIFSPNLLEKKERQLFVSPEHELVPSELNIPGDFSSAAFFIASALLAKESRVVIKRVGINPTRTGFLTIIKQMGAKITVSNVCSYGHEPVADLLVEASPLRAVTVNPETVPLAIDEYPLLFLLATQASGRSVFKGLTELRVKESDRLTVMSSLLRRRGARVSLMNDDLTIDGGSLLNGGSFDAFSDHRIGMTLAVSALVSKEALKIKNCQNINTSFPQFVEHASQLGIRIKELINES